MLRYFVVQALAAALLAATPAAAQQSPLTAAQCAADSGQVAVRAVAINQGDTITLSQILDGTYLGQGTIEVYCRSSAGVNEGDIQDASVKVTVYPDAGVTAPLTIAAQGGVATSGTNPAVIGPFSSTVPFNITAPSNLLPAGIAGQAVGTYIEVVVQAYGAPLIDPLTGATLKPGTFGDVLAQTPELDSLILFGTGALGLAGYGLTRLRSRRRRES